MKNAARLMEMVQSRKKATGNTVMSGRGSKGGGERGLL